MAIVVTLSGKFAHFKTVDSNHSSCLTYSAPTRPSLLGMVGAALGWKYDRVLEELQEQLDIGFRWLSENAESVTIVGRKKIEVNPSFDKVNKNSIHDTLDGIQYIHEINGGDLKCELFISSKNEELMNEIYNAFNNPVYPLCFGLAKLQAKIEEVEIVEAKYSKGETITDSIFISDVEVDDVDFSYIPRKSKGHRKSFDFELTGVPSTKVKVDSKFGFYEVENTTYCVMWVSFVIVQVWRVINLYIFVNSSLPRKMNIRYDVFGNKYKFIKKQPHVDATKRGNDSFIYVFLLETLNLHLIIQMIRIVFISIYVY